MLIFARKSLSSNNWLTNSASDVLDWFSALDKVKIIFGQAAVTLFVYKEFNQKLGMSLPNDLLCVGMGLNVKIYEFNLRFICEKPTAFLPRPSHRQSRFMRFA